MVPSSNIHTETPRFNLNAEIPERPLNLDVENYGKYHCLIMWPKIPVNCSLMWTPIWWELAKRSESVASMTHV